ncbi:helix-turn-helix domain-containing protein [Cellulosilyticum lentocellum]|uniref:Helix-turn-helix domain protein n=1 Tax=Cellulosilyticum lentocellum (strain ATCC 49066 / DSM 5427 / NCIMB 11756 / RHM5) TaxID=642492 RepID=F2JIG2_CELLD|nr:helix-turn-helix transcriptional regulator [Cellulosilyticum lentocellum]ADZ84328.1 helix-turn-helix domain protein [Cellulosilyticum lentocellum DSM 5427]
MLGNNIKTARKKLKLTQKELAQQLGIAEITIRKYEKGEREPNLETIEKLAVTLKVTPYELLGNLNNSVALNHAPMAEVTKNLSLLAGSPDDAINGLGTNLEILIENITANTLNKHNVPYTRHDAHAYIDAMNKLLNKLCIIANPMQFINDPEHTNLIKEIDNFMGYKLNQFNEQED